MVAGVAADVMVSSAELPLLCISDELSIEALQTFIDAHPADGQPATRFYEFCIYYYYYYYYFYLSLWNAPCGQPTATA